MTQQNTNVSSGLRASHLALAGAGVVAGLLAMNSALRRATRLDFTGKVVVITGGSRGLGLALAEEFARAGAHLVLAARDEEELTRAAEMLRSRQALTASADIDLVPVDLREESSGRHLIERATARFGKVDVLVNNAGVIFVGPVEKQPLSAYQEAIAIELFAKVQLVNAVLPQMLERGEGSIVNIASIGGKIPVPHLAPYTAAKFASVGYSATLHAELKPKGIHVTTIYPALMRTGSYPNAIVVGDLEKEYRWFSISASLPGVAHSAGAAARKIVTATAERRTEVAIGWDAFLAARLYGLLPETFTNLASIADQFLLPATTGNDTPTPARRIGPPRSRLWQALSRTLTVPQNQRSA